ncbi:hypothetical protein FVEG_00806 [Fusarium verticillioides 7600]|uniref:Uncharacterized protein n=1 Tax=Gibberella moniliformis (strain M3125 / FGSC 7600) TaxID=334819 RepID=W7LWS2_GIBM7|nr:hypothetical protein FVEG_00806 [Fusarium verticillioides 7600]XP_018743173.1 hypothetical protein FVEG_00806 [Fusarium verticillioides 7600]XP_018743174.1 hypothetical protein FVEG_00806 [Fusarium verticillioides 7600]XP_018743175.1 hypothetical protein FVEG_00806 [Fusarium verticillioides 7600]RBQ69929.1 hypothetical protein FVER14953_00806 [Fusarium verticillioides]EWG36981.1 hypothetical protein FVEG_00806 [Fusarium verticillioides 7600]EWG36982.1 hypothetical protein FVEG_00806 [Fusar
MTTNTSSQALDDLVRATDNFREQYLRALTTLQDGLVAHRRDTAESHARSSISMPEPYGPFTPPLRASTGPTFASEASLSPIFRRGRAATLESTKERPSLSAEPQHFTGSPSGSHRVVFAQDEDVSFIPLPLLDNTTATTTTREVEDYPHNIVRDHLGQADWADSQLLQHLKVEDFTPEMAPFLDDIMKRRSEIDIDVPFREFAAYEREQYSQSTFEVYEVGHNCKLTKLSADGDGDAQSDVKYTGEGPYEIPADNVDAPTVWETIRVVNRIGTSTGRITIVQEPTPLILAALHWTMSSHFDMNELLTHLLSDEPNRGRTHAFMTRAYERPPSQATSHSPIVVPSSPVPLTARLSVSPTPPTPNVRQRSFFFVFKYYTVVSHPLEPAPWQRFDKRPSESRLGDHIDIAECGSVLALSLGGDSRKAPPMRSRRERAREGVLFDTFGPWQLLAIQSFPDNSHTVRGPEFQEKKYVNGPYAFLDLLISEYRDATKRNLILHERVTKLITPPTEFMFDPKLRDKLLFEDKHFTYIRRYFWAYNTLAVVNTGIKSMIAAYIDTFTDSFWAGTHPILWPHHAADSPDGIAYSKHMAKLRCELDKVVQELTEVLKRNERTRKEIENLRDQLFSGSSIKESRRAIEQGDNIKVLTMISMIFLPLTFVTSVFGMTVFTVPATDWRFPLTMILVCVPFMLLVTFLQTRSFSVLLRKLGAIGSAPVRLMTQSRSRSREITDVPDNISAARVRRGSGTFLERIAARLWTKRSAQKVERDDFGGV